MSSPGRELVGLPAAQWIEVHRNRWPAERLAFQQAAGRVLAKALDGSARIQRTNVDDRGQMRIELGSMDSIDRAALDLPIPNADEDARPVRKSIDLQAVLLPVAVKADATWVMTQLPMNAFVELSNLDAVVCTLLVAPVMSDLSGVLRLRAGLGPQSNEGRAEKLARCRQAHDALGLRSDLITPLLNPTLKRQQVVAAREELILSWAEYPDDVGARLMALLCAHLAQAYYSKARKDGTVQEARVINTKTKPLLDSTLRDWAGLVGYLGEGLSAADARPIDVPDVDLPPSPPQPIVERIEAVREWWSLYDARHAAQQPGDPGLGGLVPPRWDYTNPYDSDDLQQGDREQYRSSLPVELVEQIEGLWGCAVLPREPGTLITEAHPFMRFGQLLRPAIEVWEDLASTCWSLCFAGWAYPLDQLEARHTKLRRELETLQAPINASVYRELCEAGRGHDWLFEQPGLVMSIAISLEEGASEVTTRDGRPPRADAASAFVALRKIVDTHRRLWIEGHIDRMLDVMWRTDVGTAAGAYWTRFRGKGAPPTIKQALPDVLGAAERWFNADYGALARLTGLSGPIAQSPTATRRQLPGNLPGLRREVAAVLRASSHGSALEPREAAYRIDEVAARSADILTYWQAVGAAPPRSAVFGPAYTFIFNEVFGCDLEHGYQLLLSATREALARSGHPAATELGPA